MGRSRSRNKSPRGRHKNKYNRNRSKSHEKSHHSRKRKSRKRSHSVSSSSYNSVSSSNCSRKLDDLRSMSSRSKSHEKSHHSRKRKSLKRFPSASSRFDQSTSGKHPKKFDDRERRIDAKRVTELDRREQERKLGKNVIDEEFEDFTNKTVQEKLKECKAEIEAKTLKRIQTSLETGTGDHSLINKSSCSSSLPECESFNVESFENSNLQKVFQFIFGIEEEVVSKINAWKIIECFDALFNEDQSSIICITRPRCWGKTTMINIILLYYSMNFQSDELPVLRNEKIPEEIFHGRKALVYKNKRVVFPTTDIKSLKYDDRASQLCFLLDFSSIKGSTLTELANDFTWAVHITLEDYLNYMPSLKNCAQGTCGDIDHLSLLSETLLILSNLNEFNTSSKILFIDEFDYPLIRVNNQADAKKLRRSLEALIRRVNQLGFKVVTFGVFPNICDDIMPNNLAKTCSVAHTSLKTAFGIDKVEEVVAVEEVESLKESVNGYTYAGTNEYSLFCYSLWKKSQVVYPLNFLKYKSFLYIENQFNQNEYFVNLTSELLKNNVKFVEKSEDSSLRNNLNILFYAGFLVTRLKAELTNEMKKTVQLCHGINQENDIPDDGIYYVFPNVIMRNSLHLFISTVLRSKVEARFGLPKVAMEFTEAELQNVIDSICRIYQCSKISCEKDYEKQLSNNLMQILLETYFVINQVPSGKGISDIILLPRSKDYPMYVIEAKWKSVDTEDELDECCLLPFHQIWTLRYHDRFVNDKTVLKYHNEIGKEKTVIYFIGIAVSSTSISCSIAPKEAFAQCQCQGDEKEKICEIVKQVPRYKQFAQR